MRILGPNETGTGILIEYDAGHISPDDVLNKGIIAEMKDMDFSKDIILYAILQKYDTPNKNGRIYPELLLKRENEKYQALIKNGGALNELNHPTSSLIDLDRVSHSILETWWDGKMLMGKIKLFTSPGWRKMGIVSTKGDQAAMLLMNGATLGISSRGVGSLKNVKGQNVVQEDYELVCFDLVSSPSTPGAYIFKNLEDKEQYQESYIEQPVINDKMKSLMGKLNNFLSKE
jgi:Prohead core protein serine protease